MKIGVPMEPEGETRVAIVPGSMKKLQKAGFEVIVEKGAGTAANYSDSEYTDAGASVGSRKDVMACDIVIQFAFLRHRNYPKGKSLLVWLIHSDILQRFRLALMEELH